MNITVNLIGRYKDIVGKPMVELEITTGDTIWHVVDAFIQKYPALEKDKKFMIISKNGVFTTVDVKVKKGDKITVAPPVVSGG